MRIMRVSISHRLPAFDRLTVGAEARRGGARCGQQPRRRRDGRVRPARRAPVEPPGVLYDVTM